MTNEIWVYNNNVSIKMRVGSDNNIKFNEIESKKWLSTKFKVFY